MKDKIQKVAQKVDWRVALSVVVAIVILQVVNMCTVKWDNAVWVGTFGLLAWLVKSPLDMFKK